MPNQRIKFSRLNLERGDTALHLLERRPLVREQPTNISLPRPGPIKRELPFAIHHVSFHQNQSASGPGNHTTSVGSVGSPASSRSRRHSQAGSRTASSCARHPPGNTTLPPTETR